MAGKPRLLCYLLGLVSSPEDFGCLAIYSLCLTSTDSDFGSLATDVNHLAHHLPDTSCTVSDMSLPAHPPSGSCLSRETAHYTLGQPASSRCVFFCWPGLGSTGMVLGLGSLLLELQGVTERGHLHLWGFLLNNGWVGGLLYCLLPLRGVPLHQ